jgi:hypothetical protein
VILRLANSLIIAVFLQVIFIIPSLSFAEEISNEIPMYIDISPYYSTEPLIVDGYDNDWKDNRYVPVMFNATSLSPSMVPIDQNNVLSGKILVRNNDSHLALLAKLDTLYPITDQRRSVTLAFDENNDGVSTEGDNLLSIGTIGSDSPQILLDSYYDEGTNPKRDRPEDNKTFEGFLRYVSDSQAVLELAIPFRGTNNYYDIETTTFPSAFTVTFLYSAGGEFSEASRFGTGFALKIVQSPQIALIPGLKVLFIFSASIMVSLATVLIVRRKRDSKSILKPNKLSMVVLLALLASILLVFLSPVVMDHSTDQIRQISASIANQNLAENIFNAIIFGILPSLLMISFFNQSESLVSKLGFSQRLLLYAPIGLFAVVLITIAATPVLLIVTSGPTFLNYDVEFLKTQIVTPLSNFIQGGISGLIVFLLSYTFSIWIPSALLIFVIYELRSSTLRFRSKIALISISLSLFVAIAIWNIAGLFVPVSDKFSYASFLLGPTIAAVIFSFLAVEGYVDTIRESLGKLRTSHATTEGKDASNIIPSENILKRVGIKALSTIVLIITIIGLSRNLFLLTIPFTYANFPLGYSLIYDYFIRAISDYAIVSSSEEGLRSAAATIYNYFAVFFSLFWLYDIIMIFRGFGGDYLNSENIIYKTLKSRVGRLTAVSFLSIMILFTINESSFSFRIVEMNNALPIWVKQQIGIQNYEFQFLSDLSSQLGLLIGLATLLSLIYVLARTRPLFKKLVNIQS